MKPEPLKNKTQSHCERRDLTDRHDIHDDTDIKSAVEWLKDRINKHKLWRNEYIESLIDKAFEDVIKK